MNPGLPFALQVELTTGCNLKCRMCPLIVQGTSSSLQPGHITESTWSKVLRMAQKVGLVLVAGFGEPFTNPKCLTLLQELNESGVWIDISTNGTLLTPRIARELSSLNHLLHINVSIDSPIPDVYWDIRGGELRKALGGLRNLTLALDDPGKVTVSAVLMNKNIATLASFPPILAELGVKTFLLQGLVDYNSRVDGENLFRHSSTSPYIDEIKEACSRADVKLLFSLPDRLDLELNNPSQARQLFFSGHPRANGETKKCCLPWELPFIDKDGRVFPCCYSATKRAAALGNLNENSLTEIWQGTAYQQFRQALLNRHTMPSICQTCTAVSWGEHPLSKYSAKILLERSVLNNRTRMRLVVQNTGTCTWTKDTPVRIGTAVPRDHPSSYFHESWLSNNRVATFAEETVAPGETATFEFRIRPAIKDVFCARFQLVVDGECWLPNTQFEIRPRNARSNRLSLFADWIDLRLNERNIRLEQQVRKGDQR